jgi:hypothetical protein
MTSNSIAFPRQSTPKTDDPKVTATVFCSLAQTEVLGDPQTNESGSAYAGYGFDAELRAMVRGEDLAEMMFYPVSDDRRDPKGRRADQCVDVKPSKGYGVGSERSTVNDVDTPRLPKRAHTAPSEHRCTRTALGVPLLSR